MPSDPHIPADPNEEARERLYEQVSEITKSLKAAKKILNRDWEQLSPGERSAQSRVVKDYEKQIRDLEEEIEIHRPQIP